MNKLNLGCGKIIKEGWVNIDKFANPGVNQQLDLFKVPYNIPDDSADEFFISHFIEHIPHELKPAPYPDTAYISGHDWEWWTNRQKELLGLDGFFAFFAEVYRIGVNGAVVNVVCPNGFSDGGLQDPTHTRYIVGPTFSYLALQGKEELDSAWDYYLPLKFDIVEARFEGTRGSFTDIIGRELNPEESDLARVITSHFTNMAETLYVTLKVNKDAVLKNRP